MQCFVLRVLEYNFAALFQAVCRNDSISTSDRKPAINVDLIDHI